MIGKYKIIGVFACSAHSEYAKDIITTIIKNFQDDEYRVLLFNSYDSLYYNNDDAKGSESIFSLIDPSVPDVMIVLAESMENPAEAERIIRRMREAGVPVICVDKQMDDCVSVSFSYVDSFEKIVRHIVEHHGCKRINFMAGTKGNEFSEERISCFRKVLAENGIEADERRIDYGDFWEYPTIDAMNRFMETGLEMPEAIICANDSMAIAVCRFLKEKGYRIPEDVMVTGFDGIELEKYNIPRLTTAAIDIEYLGLSIRQTCDRIFAGEEPEKNIIVPYKVRYVQSCGCVPVKADYAGNMVLEIHENFKRNDYHENHMYHYLAKATKCSSYDELADILPEYSDYDFWCCLNKDFIKSDGRYPRYNENYTEEMYLLLHRSGEEKSRNMDFDIHELLPDMEKVLDGIHYLMFCPLNFHASVYGYIAVSIHEHFPYVNNKRFTLNSALVFEIFRQQKLLQIANAELDLMQMTDSMTGLYNRRGFYKKTEPLFDSPENSLVIFSVDMDSLKYINDTFGHKEGDRAIKAVSEALKDAAEDAVAARFGGDEFAVLMPSDTPEVSAAAFREKVASILDDFNRVSDAPYKVHASIGAAVMKNCSHKDIEDYLKQADSEMYSVKQQYKIDNNIPGR